MLSIVRYENAVALKCHIDKILSTDSSFSVMIPLIAHHQSIIIEIYKPFFDYQSETQSKIEVNVILYLHLKYF